MKFLFYIQTIQYNDLILLYNNDFYDVSSESHLSVGERVPK